LTPAGPGLDINGKNWIVFVGCRFQSNRVADANVSVYGGSANIYFYYCTICPRVALVTAPPNGSAVASSHWRSCFEASVAGQGLPTKTLRLRVDFCGI
jgi:hypothetical protein